MASGGYEPMYVNAPTDVYGRQSGPLTPLAGRLAGVESNFAAAQGNFHPDATIPGGMTMPMTMTTVTADTVQVDQMTPLYAGPDSAPIPATAVGRWDQVRAAGRP